MAADDMKLCGHGKPFDAGVRCIECEIVWYRECHRDAVARVASTGQRINDLEREIANGR